MAAGRREMAESSTSTRYVSGFVVAILLVHAVLLAWGALRHSPTWNEPAHLAAGMSHWRFGRFALYQVNPPLVRLVAAAPVMMARPQVDWAQFYDDRQGRSEFAMGEYFLWANGLRSCWLVTIARWACLPFSILGGYICFRWSRELFGTPAGMMALVLWCLSPTILAHAQLMTPDAGAATAGVAAGYTFWRWLRKASAMWTLLAGLSLGFAALTKSTWVILFLLWPLLWMVWRWADHREGRGRRWLPESCQLGLIVLLALFLVNVCYGFEDSFRRLGDFRFGSRALGGRQQSLEGYHVEGNRFAKGWGRLLPVPIPANYVLGMDSQRWDFERRAWSYLRGQWRKGGWWYYYLYVLLIKVPLGTWALVLLGLGAAISAARYRTAWRDEIALVGIPLAVLVLVSCQTGINQHLRYVLPVFPFLFIWVSRVSLATRLRDRWLAIVAIAAVSWSAASSLWVYPHSLSYFNETVGGPTGGHRHLLGSNVDWGQDMLFLKRWLDSHPEAWPLPIAHASNLDTRLWEIELDPAPVAPNVDEEWSRHLPPGPGPGSGWHAISVNYLHGRTGRFARFLSLKPVATVGYSIYIYHVPPPSTVSSRRLPH